MKKIQLTSALSLALLLGLTACQPNRDADQKSSKTDQTGTKSDKVDQDQGGSDLDKAKALVQGSSQGRFTTNDIFDGPDGMKGIIVQDQQGTGKQVVWASPSFEVLIPGPALTKDGKNLSETALNEQNVYLSAEKLADELTNTGFVVGTKGPVVTAFMDPNCIFCNRFYNDVMPLVKKGELRVRFVMVGFLKPTSIPRSVAILAAKNPAQALDRDEKNFDAKNEEGGEAPATGSHPKEEAEVRANGELLAKSGPVSTPTLVFCKEGNGPEIFKGQPQDIKAFVAALDKNANHKLCSGK